MSRLITSSLISSIRWAKTCPASWKERADRDLKNTLARIWTEPNEAAQLGMTFEKCLFEFIENNIDPNDIQSTEIFREIVRRYKGKKIEIQKKVKRFININNHEYCLYGKLDILFSPPVNSIKDIKTTSKLMDNYDIKYLSTFQHHLYCFITEIPDFQYFIVVFNEHTKKIIKTQEIEYHVIEMEDERRLIENEIKEVFTYLEMNPELLKLYKDKYCLY